MRTSARLRVAGFLVILTGLVTPPLAEATRITTTMVICPSEAGRHVRCVWDGRHLGDRHSRSFVTYTTRDHGRIVIRKRYVTHETAHRLVLQIRRQR